MKSELKNINLLLLDVDGVLTDGSIIYDDKGIETKIFNVKDGFGIRLLIDAGIEVGIITGRSSKALTSRCNNLGITLCYDGVVNKDAVLDEILQKTGKTLKETAFMGDDLPDLSVLTKVGVSITVSDANESIKERVHIVTKARGGEGAVREVCESILKAKGLWEDIINAFL